LRGPGFSCFDTVFPGKEPVSERTSSSSVSIEKKRNKIIFSLERKEDERLI